MSAPVAGRKFDSLDFFLGVMTLLTVVAVFFLFHSWGKMSELERVAERADDALAEIRESATHAPPADERTREGVPPDGYFTVEVPGTLQGRGQPNSVRVNQPAAAGEGWLIHSFVASWNDVARLDLALYVRQVESDWPGVRAAGLELRPVEPKDPERDRWKATATFTFYSPEPD